MENEDIPEVLLPSQNVEMIANSNFESVPHIAENIIFPCNLGEPEVALRENGNNNEGYNNDEGHNNAVQSTCLLVIILLAILWLLFPCLEFFSQEYYINNF